VVGHLSLRVQGSTAVRGLLGGGHGPA